MENKTMQVVHSIQNSMQAAFAPWAVIETWLKKANEHKLPISINGLMSLEEVKKVVRDSQQCRDIVSTYMNKGMVTRHDLSPDQRTGDKRDRVGYSWNPDFKGESYRPSARIVANQMKKPGKVTSSTPGAAIIGKDKALVTDKPKAVEVIFQGMTVTIGRNPDNGNVQILIEA